MLWWLQREDSQEAGDDGPIESQSLLRRIHVRGKQEEYHPKKEREVLFGREESSENKQIWMMLILSGLHGFLQLL